MSGDLQDPDDLRAALAECRAELAELRAELAALRQAPGAPGPTAQPLAAPGPTAQPLAAPGPTARSLAAPAAATSPAPTPPVADRRWSRRALLAGGAGAVAGSAASTLAAASPAAASTGAMQYGADNDAGAAATTLTSSNYQAFRVTNSSLGMAIVADTSSVVNVPAIYGSNSGQGAGVSGRNTNSGFGLQGSSDTGPAAYAQSNSGIGVYARSMTGVGLVAYSGSRAPMHLQHGGKDAVPAGTAFEAGSFFATNDGEVWLCVTSGTPGSWRLIAGPQAAGAYCPITPARVYDSRWDSVPGLTTGALTNGTVRTVPTANGRNATGTITAPNAIPAGARALTLNLTITGTANTGYIGLVPGTQQSTTTSSINWTATGQTAANGLTVPLDPATRTLNAICAATTANGQPGRSHIIIDVTGYFLGL